jgi:hypothetical protein
LKSHLKPTPSAVEHGDGMAQWITTPLDAAAVPTLALGPPGPGATRRYVGAVDVELGTIGAVAVVDVDAGGGAWVRLVAGDPERLTGLADTLRALGARLLVSGDPPQATDL